VHTAVGLQRGVEVAVGEQRVGVSSTSHSALWNAHPTPTPHSGSEASAAWPTTARPGCAAGRLTLGTSSPPISRPSRDAPAMSGASGSAAT
jgi:hypothetical protein